MTRLSRRAFLARAGAAGLATPLLVKAATAWGDSIDFRPGPLVEGELFVWPDKLVVRGPGILVRRCAFLGPSEAGLRALAPGSEAGTAGAPLVMLDAEDCEVRGCWFARLERITPDDLARAEAFIRGEWPGIPEVDRSKVDRSTAAFLPALWR